MKLSIRLGVLLFGGLLLIVSCCAESPDQAFINVRHYGAKGDGTTDDSRAIQSALDAAERGGTVYFPAAPKSYYITTCLHPKSNTVLMGDGAASELTIPGGGWRLFPGICYGIINLYRVQNVHINGLHIVGTKEAEDSNNTPKLIYLQSADNIQIDNNLLENTQFEGIWEGGSAEETTHVAISNNYFASCGYGPKSVGLPCIQANMDQAIIFNNRLYDVGMGIGASGSNLVVSGNEVNGIRIYGISVGDGVAGTVLVTGNHVSFAEDPTGFVVRVGYQADNPVEKPAPLFAFTGNSCKLTGLPNLGKGNCYRQGSATNVTWNNNSAEISVRGSGFLFFGSPNGALASVSANICRIVDGSNQSECFIAKPNGQRNSLTIYSSGNHAYGATRADKSFGFDYNTIGGGSLVAYSSGDWSAEGFVRIDSEIYNTSGSWDGIPFTVSNQNVAAMVQNLTFGGASFSNLGSPQNGTVMYCPDCSAITEGAVCAGSGSGKLAVRINAQWRCF